MKFHKRYLFLIIAILAAAGFVWAGYGHIYRLRMETPSLCKELGGFCFAGHKVQVDVLDEHRGLILNSLALVSGLSLMSFVVAFFRNIKRKRRNSKKKLKSEAGDDTPTSDTDI